MFRKLLKYDMRAIWRIWWILAVSAAGLSVLGGLALRIMNDTDTTSQMPLLQIFAALAMFVCVMGLVAFVVGAEILVYYRFYKNLFTDEGYLTFTLPASRAKILASKTLNAWLWLILTFLTLGACVLILLGVSGALAEIDFSAFEGFFRGAHIGNLLYFFAIVIEVLVIIAAGCWVSVGLVHLCITIGAVLAKKHKLLAAIGIYYLANMILSFVMQVFMVLGIFGTMGAAETLLSKLTEVEILVFLPLVLALVAVIVSSTALLIHYVILGKLERRLNLA